jgi:CTP:molybdopterin cytidylyltransferase MocA
MDAVFKLEDNLLLFFTGFSRSAGGILADQKTRTEKHDDDMLRNLEYVKDLGFRSRDALQKGDTALFGELLHEHWEQKRRRSSAMSNPRIDEWYELGRKNGAIGGKLVGAGGGGFLMFYAEDHRRLRSVVRWTRGGAISVRLRRHQGSLRMMLPVAIVAGGVAQRLRPLTETIPKALVDVAGRPFAEHQLEWLGRQGVHRVVFLIGYRGEMIREALGDGSRWGLAIEYVFDGPTLMGTGGAIKRALPALGTPFFVMYGDSYLDCDLADIAEVFCASGAEGLMTVFRNDNRWTRATSS